MALFVVMVCLLLVNEAGDYPMHWIAQHNRLDLVLDFSWSLTRRCHNVILRRVFCGQAHSHRSLAIL